MKLLIHATAKGGYNRGQFTVDKPTAREVFQQIDKLMKECRATIAVVFDAESKQELFQFDNTKVRFHKS